MVSGARMHAAYIRPGGVDRVGSPCTSLIPVEQCRVWYNIRASGSFIYLQCF